MVRVSLNGPLRRWNSEYLTGRILVSGSRFQRSIHGGGIRQSQVPLLPPPLSLSPTLQPTSNSISSSNLYGIDDAVKSARSINVSAKDGHNAAAVDGDLSHNNPGDQNRAIGDVPEPDKPNENAHDDGGESTTSLVVSPPPGVRFDHYFDTYSMFSQLHKAGFSDEQAIILLKCVRGLLAKESHQAKETYLSSAEMENEAYLFDAACSELRTEIQNNRKNQTVSAQAETDVLQREYQILRALTEEELDFMKNEVGMELNERKNSSKADSRRTELQIQELNNRITIAISSDLRSEIESLRWQTTRRGLFAIGVITSLILTALSYRRESEAKAKAAAAAAVAAKALSLPDNVSDIDATYVT